jgi:hypothetical protein
MASGTSHMTKQIRFLNSAWKMGSDWYITSLDHIHFCLIPILEILCCGPNYEWINEWMNEWKKSLSSGMIKNESYFVRTRNPGLARQLPCSWASTWGWSIYAGLGPSMCSPLWDVTLPPPLSCGAPGHRWLWGLWWAWPTPFSPWDLYGPGCGPSFIFFW